MRSQAFKQYFAYGKAWLQKPQRDVEAVQLMDAVR